MATWNEIDYAGLVEAALLGVVRDILRRVADDGLPGDHYLYLTFRTADPGVEMPEYLKTRYPEEMTVILQHQFWDLEVDDDRFAVSLSFGGARRRLVVPFAALGSFVDPAAKVGLRFGAAAEGVQGTVPAEGPEAAGPGNEQEPLPAGDDSGAEILSFERFRKKRDS